MIAMNLLSYPPAATLGLPAAKLLHTEILYSF